MTLLEAMADRNLFAPWFRDSTTWAAWRFLTQLVSLERRTARGGAHDDLANAVAGLAAATRSKYAYDSSLDWVSGPDYGKSDADAA
jgi:hypothetical protein